MTNGNKINKLPAKIRVLVAPLEWGLGHATRCIPIIKELLLNGAEVFIAAEGATKSLLKNEFPDLKFLELTGYRMKYSRKKVFLPLKLLVQIPKIIFNISNEHQWLKKIIKAYKIDSIISDNRFGLYNSKIYSVYLTHQLLIKTGNIFTEKAAKKIHYHFIKKYNECWVPDFKKNGIAGELSHPLQLPKNIKYIGALSRFEIEPYLQKKYDLLVTLSGPEPQRTLFEEKILSETDNYHGKILVVRGLPEIKEVLYLKNENIQVVNHLSALEMNKVILQSDLVICRSGYTSIMDLIKLGKKAILIPTPGQTEQEYLAKYMMEQKYFYSTEQKYFSLEKVLTEVANFHFQQSVVEMDYYKMVIKEFVHSLYSANLQLNNLS